MNIIEKMKEIIMQYPNIDEFSGGLHIDYMDSKPGNFGLSSMGAELADEDILGNQRWKHRFVLYANAQSYNDFNRLNNSNFLLNFSYWLSQQKDIYVEDNQVNYGEELSNNLIRNMTPQNNNCPYTITSITPANGMMFSIPDKSTNDKITYQLQITVEYTITFEALLSAGK